MRTDSSSDPPVPPGAPAGVRAHMADGRNVPLECRYAGWDAQCGFHVWEPTNLPTGAVVRITVDAMPPRTEIRIRVGRAA